MSSQTPLKTTVSKTILIAEDHALFSEGVKLVLESTKPNFKVFQAKNGKLAVEQARMVLPDVILMDIAMPEMNGFEASQTLKKEMPDTRIIMLTSFTDEKSLRLALSCGVEAYCSKDIAFKRLLGVIDMVLNGGFYLDPTVAHFMLKQHAATQPDSTIEQQNTGEMTLLPEIAKTAEASQDAIEESSTLPEKTPDQQVAEKRYAVPADEQRMVSKLDIPKPQPIKTDKLTARELELLSLIADYRNNEEIAAIMKISEAWVNGYIKEIIFKLAVNNEIEAVRRAVDDGVITKAKIFEQEEFL
jgi:two-component system, NarL family, response regulator LiaR